MAAFDTSRPQVAASTVSVSRIFANMIAMFNAWNDERVTRKSLSQLTARELDDIGLHHGDIDAVARRISR